MRDGRDTCIETLDDMIASLVIEKTSMKTVDQFVALRKFLAPKNRTVFKRRMDALVMFVAWCRTNVDGFEDALKEKADFYHERSKQRGIIPAGLRH